MIRILWLAKRNSNPRCIIMFNLAMTRSSAINTYMTNQLITLPETLHEGYEQRFEGDQFAVFDPSSLEICDPPKPFVTADGVHGKVLAEQVVDELVKPFAILALVQGYSCGNGGFSKDRTVSDDRRAQNHWWTPGNNIYAATAVLGIAAGVIVRQQVVHFDARSWDASNTFHAKLEKEQKVLGSELLKTLGLVS